MVGVGQGLNSEIVDVADMSLKEVVALIRGKAGTIVRLKVQPAIGGDPKIIDITRASIELKDAKRRAPKCSRKGASPTDSRIKLA